MRRFLRFVPSAIIIHLERHPLEMMRGPINGKINYMLNKIYRVLIKRLIGLGGQGEHLLFSFMLRFFVCHLKVNHALVVMK